MVSALRAQGELTKERRKVMNDLSNILNIPIERHKAEIRRAINDELLNTIAARYYYFKTLRIWIVCKKNPIIFLAYVAMEKMSRSGRKKVDV